MSQIAENALLNVEDNTIQLWNMANEATDDVNTNEMIDFLEEKGKNPPLPLKKSRFLSWYAPTRYDPDQKYNMNQYNHVYVERAKLAWKLYKTYQDQIQGHKSEEDRASRAEIDKERYNKTKYNILQNIRVNFNPNDTKYETYLRSLIESLNETDRNYMMNELLGKKNQEKKTGLLSMFGVPSFFRKNGGKSKRVKRVKRSRRVKRSTKRRKH